MTAFANEAGSPPEGARLAAALRALQHEFDELLGVQSHLLGARQAYVLGRATEALIISARMGASATVLESVLGRLVRSIPPVLMTPTLEQTLHEAVALCIDPVAE